MQDMPHHYQVLATAEAEGNILLRSENLPQLVSAAPAEFGGPGNQWSPEHLLIAAVADCFVLTLRAVATASKVDWTDLEVAAEGTLDRVEVAIVATLTVPAGTDPEKAQRVMEKSEAACLITNSMNAETHLTANVVVAD